MTACIQLTLFSVMYIEACFVSDEAGAVCGVGKGLDTRQTQPVE